MKRLIIVAIIVFISFIVYAGDIGQWSSNKYNPESTSNRFGYGSQFKPKGVNNQFGTYGSPSSNKSVRNPYATDTPRLYNSRGEYRGKLSSNPYDPDSVSNPFGRYGSKFSPNSVNNQFGAGNKFNLNSPTNPYGKGLKMIGPD